MSKGIIGVIGLIGGILILVGVFTPWVTASALGYWGSVSAWDCITGRTSESATYCYLALVGGVLALMGALFALTAPELKVLWAILAIGGILAIVSAIWGFSDIETGRILGLSFNYGYGLYLTLGGGILGLIGSLGLKE
jgi:hypothetical protein